LHLLGKGAFGLVHAALDTHTQTQVAIKIEPPSAKKQVLRLEIAVLKKLTASSSATPSAARGRERGVGGGVYSYLVMRLLGPNLSDIRRTTPTHRFSLAATSHLAVQMLHALETLHGVGIVHRDVKPGNFCLETARTTTPPSSALDCARIYIIDFGLSRRYLSSTDNTVLPARSKVGFRGTSRYASPRAHAGLDLSPVDDLWSLFYVVVECVTGSLPWKGREKSRIAEIKQ
ncbi:kinase-like domain-containing protein, partial [Powellomyces hirtus]